MSSGGSKKQNRGPGFVCVFCDKYFAGTCNQSIHIRRHIHEKPYNCVLCDYSAACTSDVGQHEKKVHSSKDIGVSYKCSKCTKIFTRLVFLENHLRTHHELQMACQESVEVKVEVKMEEDMEMEATTSFPPPPISTRRRTWTPEQIERRRMQRRELYRKKKLEEQKRKEEGLEPPPPSLTEEELEKQKERRRKKAELERKYIARIKEEDPERYEEIKKRKREKRKGRLPLTEEELEEQERRRSKKAELQRKYSATRTPEQRERRRLCTNERSRKRKLEIQKRKEEGLPLTKELEDFERRRLWKNERQRINKERRKKEDPERFEEMKKRSRFQSFVKKAAMTTTMTEEELKQHKLKQFLRSHAYYKKGGRWSERSEEWKERQKEARNRWLQKNQLRGIYDKMKVDDPAKWERFCEKQKAYQRERYAKETPEKRERRRWKEKVNGARRRLKKKLENEGVGEEEIQKRDEELKVRMWKEFDPEGEVPGSTSRYRRKTKKPPKMSADFTPTQNQTEEEGGFGLDDYFGSSSMPPSPSPDDSTFPDPDTQFLPKVEACSRDFPSTDDFQCSHCSSTFQDGNERSIHIQLIHPTSCWKCPMCDEVVLSSAELSQHYNSVHKRIQSETVEHLKKQNTKEKSSFPFQCMRCPPTLPNSRIRDDNSKGKFKTRLELLSHVKRNHPGSYWPCKDCHLLKYSEQSLQIHLNYCRLRHASKRRGES